MLLITLGAETSAKVLQQLAPDEVERLASGIVMLKRVDKDVRQKVLSECSNSLLEGGPLAGADYASKLLEQAVGGQKAKELLNKVNSGGSDAFASLRRMSPGQLAALVSHERAQIVALVVAHLPAEQAGQVVAALPDRLQGEVILRLTTMKPTDPEFVEHVDDILQQRVSEGGGGNLSEVGGTSTVAQILSNVDRSTEKKIMDYLTETDPKVAEEIKENMFVFEDILSLDDRAIQVILRDLPQEDLRLALKGSPEDVRETFYRNMSQRVVDTLKEDLDASGPIKRRDVDGAQGRIANIARQLDEAGEISLRESGDDMVE